MEAGILPYQHTNSNICVFSAEDVNNGAMDDWIKLVQIKQWQRHDGENCTVFYFSSHLIKSDHIKKYLMMQVSQR